MVCRFCADILASVGRSSFHAQDVRSCPCPKQRNPQVFHGRPCLVPESPCIRRQNVSLGRVATQYTRRKPPRSRRPLRQSIFFSKKFFVPVFCFRNCFHRNDFCHRHEGHPPSKKTITKIRNPDERTCLLPDPANTINPFRNITYCKKYQAGSLRSGLLSIKKQRLRKRGLCFFFTVEDTWRSS